MKNKGKGMIVLGLLLVAAALFLVFCNLYDQYRAERAAEQVLQQLQALIPEKEQGTLPEQPGSGGEFEIPDYLLNPKMEMPSVVVGGAEYIGILKIPELELELPVAGQWSEQELKTAPCRYKGSAYTGTLIIAGYNYRSHFGRLKTLRQGAQVTFTDLDGNVFFYRVVEQENLPAAAVEEMEGGGWDLTMFTCTTGGQSRVTVRCEAEGP